MSLAMAVRVYQIPRLWCFEESMPKSIIMNNVFTKSLFPNLPIANLITNNTFNTSALIPLYTRLIETIKQQHTESEGLNIMVFCACLQIAALVAIEHVMVTTLGEKNCPRQSECCVPYPPTSARPPMMRRYDIDRLEIVCYKSVFSFLFSFYGRFSILFCEGCFLGGAGTRKVIAFQLLRFSDGVASFFRNRFLKSGLQKKAVPYKLPKHMLAGV